MSNKATIVMITLMLMLAIISSHLQDIKKRMDTINETMQQIVETKQEAEKMKGE